MNFQIVFLILIGLVNASSFFSNRTLSNEVRHEIRENLELFVGGGVTALVADQLNIYFSDAKFAKYPVMVKFLQGGLTTLFFVILAHLLRSKWHNHDNEANGSRQLNGGSNLRSGSSPAVGNPTGPCCPNCVSNSINSRYGLRRKKSHVNEESSSLGKNYPSTFKKMPYKEILSGDYCLECTPCAEVSPPVPPPVSPPVEVEVSEIIH